MQLGWHFISFLRSCGYFILLCFLNRETAPQAYPALAQAAAAQNLFFFNGNVQFFFGGLVFSFFVWERQNAIVHESRAWASVSRQASSRLVCFQTSKKRILRSASRLTSWVRFGKAQLRRRRRRISVHRIAIGSDQNQWGCVCVHQYDNQHQDR